VVTAVAADGIGPKLVNPDIPIDCGVWENPPVKSGGTVYGSGGVSCATNHANLQVDVELVDGHRQFYSYPYPKTCYNTNTCSNTAYGTYIGGRYWTTEVSGFVGSWNAYIQTNPAVYIP
jgi:hypothetical protein